jgi:hypothetical protein
VDGGWWIVDGGFQTEADVGLCWSFGQRRILGYFALLEEVDVRIS